MVQSQNQSHAKFSQSRLHPWRLLTAATVMTCTATVLGFGGRWSWIADLFAHFRVQYMVSLIFMAIAFCAGRKYRIAATCILFAAINMALIVPLYLGSPPPVAASPKTTRAMLLNVNSSSGNVTLVKQAIGHYHPDFIALEEINAHWMAELKPLSARYPYAIAQPRDDNFGMVLFSKLPLAQPTVLYLGDAKIPTLTATLHLDGKDLRVIATHPVPPTGAEYARLRNQQLEAVSNYIARCHSAVLLLGDLNASPWSYSFRKLLADTKLLDSSQGRGVFPTWPTNNPLLRIPLDHCLHSPVIAIQQKQIGMAAGSDHYPVLVDFYWVNAKS